MTPMTVPPSSPSSKHSPPSTTPSSIRWVGVLRGVGGCLRGVGGCLRGVGGCLRGMGGCFKRGEWVF